MQLISSDGSRQGDLGMLLEGFECPAILVAPDYQILAYNSHYTQHFGDIELEQQPRCFSVSHAYSKPCDESGEDCPMRAAKASGKKERILHVHQTPRGKEYVDVEMLPILAEDGTPRFYIELLKSVSAGSDHGTSNRMVGSSKAFTRTMHKIAKVSETDASVLLLGESGTGKELAAQAIHSNSHRSDKSLVTLECAGLTDTLFESELFGHVKGAFTGASSHRTGLIVAAEGGTLFLDEIGDVPMSMQVKLLRLLESRTYRPVGSSEVKHANFRLICATHKNIPELIAQGLFREDLYYRINVFPVRIPALRHRKEDLQELCSLLLHNLSPDTHYRLTQSAFSVLKSWDFPGNIRELRNILYRALVLSDSNVIDVDIMSESLVYGEESHPQKSQAGGDVEADCVQNTSHRDLKTVEKHYLQQLMRDLQGDKERVAQVAGISVRSLYRKLERESAD
ncbi:sigma-54 interaction domain-containing protein [Pseudomaricurvus sp.]|uniref:sigma-54 interaction domain-containing protein n=1 Tax=Pseudomaricurvus sp. TaxID=2004510 RepID=UPI003F6B5FE6